MEGQTRFDPHTMEFVEIRDAKPDTAPQTSLFLSDGWTVTLIILAAVIASLYLTTKVWETRQKIKLKPGSRHNGRRKLRLAVYSGLLVVVVVGCEISISTILTT